MRAHDELLHPLIRLALPQWIRKTSITPDDWHLYWAWENARRRAGCVDELFDNPYHRYVKTLHWQRFRACILILAEMRCAECERQAVDVYHLTYANLGRERLFDVIPLCEKCYYERQGGPLGVELKRCLASLASSAAV